MKALMIGKIWKHLKSGVTVKYFSIYFVIQVDNSQIILKLCGVDLMRLESKQ